MIIKAKSISIFLVFILSFLTFQTSSAFAVGGINSPDSVSAKADLDQMTAGVSRHLKNNSQGLYFDENSAIVAGENGRVILAGRNFNSLVAGVRDESTSVLNESGPYTYGVKIPVWGNWCGPGHSGPGAPVDTLDTLCMRHDKCYATRGYFNCACDAQLKAEIDRYVNRMSSKERAMAAAVKLAFSVGVCNPF